MDSRWEAYATYLDNMALVHKIQNERKIKETKKGKKRIKVKYAKGTKPNFGIFCSYTKE